MEGQPGVVRRTILVRHRERGMDYQQATTVQARDPLLEVALFIVTLSVTQAGGGGTAVQALVTCTVSGIFILSFQCLQFLF